MSDPGKSDMARALRCAGYRMTKPRLAVVQVLAENDEGLSPDEIHNQGRDLYARLGLVTVYRTLELLDELGMVRRVHSEERCHRYASAGPDRHYLVCEECHRVLEFPCGGMESLIEGVGARSGFAITEHLLELRGVCPDCQSLGARSATENESASS